MKFNVNIDPQKKQKEKAERAQIGMSMQSVINSALASQMPQQTGGQMSMPANPNGWGRNNG